MENTWEKKRLNYRTNERKMRTIKGKKMKNENWKKIQKKRFRIKYDKIVKSNILQNELKRKRNIT